MLIGVPTEIKPLEGRVSMVPDAVAELVRAGHELLIQQGAGEASGYTDAQYQSAGGQIVDSAEAVYQASLVVKVKEPVAGDLALLRDDQLLFSYLHLAAEPALSKKLCEIGLTAIGFETVQLASGALPLLAPMSDIAGRLSVQIGTHLLHAPEGGKGILLGGLPGTPRGKVVILGAGTAGGNAAAMAAGIGAEVVVFDRNRDKLARMRALGDNVTGLHAYTDSIAEQVAQADLLVGAVLVTGEKAPQLVSEEMVASMQAGSVILDISVDQGGCIATTRPTDYREPTYIKHGVVHFGVTNMPGAVPRTASQALSAAIFPWIGRLAESNWRDSPELSAAVNVEAGKLVHPALQA